MPNATSSRRFESRCASRAPTGAIQGAPTGAVAEGTEVTLTATASDAGAADQLSLSWTVMKFAGPPRAASGSLFATGSGASFTFTPDDNGFYDVTLTIADDNGNPLAETTVHRPGLAPGIRVQQVTDDGIIGVYATPAEMDPGEPRPAVLAFGGSEGGGEFAAATARWIAGLGYPALGISYFGSDGQPTRLEEVPVETFLTALDWLHQQPGVDGERVECELTVVGHRRHHR